MKLFERRQDTMTQHLENTAVLTVFKWLHQTSSDGRQEYLQGFEINIFGKRYHYARIKTEFHL